MTQTQICMGDVIVGQCSNGRSCYGLVERAGYDFDEDSDVDEESLEDGCVHVAWYPDGKCQSIKEAKLQVVDRSNLPRDIVRSKHGRQLGTVLNVDVICDVTIVGTDKTIKKVDTSNFHHILDLVEGEMVAYGPWLGTIDDVYESLVIRFPNGARARMSLESDESDLLGDVYPHPSDEGSFCDDGFQYFPGQSLSGVARAFRKVEWLGNGPRPKLRAKAKLKVLVEQVEVHGISVDWAHRALSCRPSSTTTSCSTEESTQSGTISDDERSENTTSMAPSMENVEDKRTDFEKFLGLNVDPFKPPPKDITGDRLKHVKRILHFWKAHIGLGSRFLYQLTEEDANNLNSQAKPPSTKSKRSKRVSTKQKSHTRKVSRCGSSSSATKRESAVGRNDSAVARDSDTDDSSSADDEDDDDEPPVKLPVTRSTGANDVDATGSDVEECVVESEASSNSYDKMVKSLHMLTHKVGSFKFKIKESGSGVNISLQNPHCPPKVLRAIKKMLSNHLNKVVHKESNPSLASLTTNKLNDMIIQSVNASSLRIRFDEEENTFIVTGDTPGGTRPKSTENTDIVLCDLDRNSSDEDGQTTLIERNNNLNKTSYCGQSIAGHKHQAGKKVKYEAGQFATIEVCCTHSSTNVEWQDGTTTWTPGVDLIPAHHVDDHDFCPGDFVVREGEAQADRYGLVMTANNENRMVTVQWFKHHDNEKIVEVLNTEELSEYDVIDHPDFTFRVSDIILRLQVEDSAMVSWGQVIGELLRVTTDGKLLVKWSDESETLVYPQEVFLIDPDIGDSSMESSCEDTPDDISGWWTDSEANGGSSDGSHPSVNLDLPREGVPLAADATPASDEPSNLNNSLEASPEDIHSGMVAQATINSMIDGALEVISNEQSAPVDTNSCEDEVVENVVEDNAFPVEDQQNALSAVPARQQFFSEEAVPANHIYAATEFIPKQMKQFVKALRKDLNLLRASLPAGIYVKTYDDRMDLLSILIEGPPQTPYENGIFLFDAQLPGDYPESPPRIHYISYSSRLNPNLYVDGTVCISLLGTWSGKGSEKWTENSNLFQVLLSIQGLILNSEPYYNEAGYESHRTISEGSENSRCYNEMVVLRLVEHMTSLIQSPSLAFPNLARDLCKVKVQNFISRINLILKLSESDSINRPNPLQRCTDVTQPPNYVDDVTLLPSSDTNVAGFPDNHADDVTIPSADVTDALNHDTTSSDLVATDDAKPTCSSQGRAGFDVGFPLYPLSKGVQLSLRCKLERLNEIAKSCTFLNNN